MKQWQARLRADDPGRDAVMPADAAQRMRRIVVAAASEHQTSARLGWPRAFVAAAAALVVVCATVLAALHQSADELRQRQAVQLPAVEGTAAPEAERTQLQFTTPGGTRIIWVFDADFDVKGTLP